MAGGGLCPSGKDRSGGYRSIFIGSMASMLLWLYMNCICWLVIVGLGWMRFEIYLMEFIWEPFSLSLICLRSAFVNLLRKFRKQADGKTNISKWLCSLPYIPTQLGAFLRSGGIYDIWAWLFSPLKMTVDNPRFYRWDFSSLIMNLSGQLIQWTSDWNCWLSLTVYL